MWKKLIRKFHERKVLLARIRALEAELQAIDAVLDSKRVAFSELDVKRNVELSIDNLRWQNEQLQAELCYYKRKYGEEWKS